MPWTDLVDPTRDELLRTIAGALDADALELLTEPAGDGRDARPVFESHGRHLVAVLLVPRPADHDDTFDYLELDVVATTDTIVTIRKQSPGGELASLGAFDTAVESGRSVGMLLHRLVDDVTDAYMHLVDAVYISIDRLEDDVEAMTGEEIRRRISNLRHEILIGRRNVTATRAATRRVLDGRLDLGDNRLFPDEVESAFADTYDTLVRASEELDIARDLLGGVRDYVQSRVAESQNEVVKKLTVVASLVLVPTLITGFYGQNFAGEFRRWWWTVGMSVGLIVLTTLAQLAFFRWKRWI